MLSCFSYVQRFAIAWTVACPNSSAHKISQAGILKWVSLPSLRGFPNLGIKPLSPALQENLNHNNLWKILKEMGILEHPTCLLRILYAGQGVTVGTGHGTTD